jgi:[acyl-carrier-protein] S-malonyltransferase
VTQPIAFLFPGQASQSVGMGRDLYDQKPAARAVFDEADETLGFSLSKLCFEGPMETLTETRNAQPAILAHSLAVAAVLKEAGMAPPALVAGHSLGEFSAAAVAGALSVADALRAVRRRGELMYEAGSRVPGTMAAVMGLDAATIETVCAELSAARDDVVVLANLNSPVQSVISGNVGAVEAAIEPLKRAGARRVIPLSVSGAFHSPLMHCVQGELRDFLESLAFADPKCPVVSNVTAKSATTAAALRTGFVEQLVSPVCWHDSVAEIVSQGVGRFVEVGPGNVLTTLGARAFRPASFQATATSDGIEKVLATAIEAG